MGMPGPLRSSLSQYRKRKQLSLDGTIGGIESNRYRPGLGSACPGQTNVRRRGDPPGDYASRHPDAYDPHPGEAVSPDSLYSPYRADMVNRTHDEIGAPVAGFESDGDRSMDGTPPIGPDLARWLLRRFVSNPPSQAAPDAIPLDHEVTFEGPAGPTVDPPVGSQHVSDAQIRELWEQVVNRPTYASSQMTEADFLQAMNDASRVVGGADAAMISDGTAHDRWLPTFDDQIAAHNDEVPPSCMRGGFQDIDAMGMAADSIFEPRNHDEFDLDDAHVSELPGEDQFPDGFDGLDLGSLEQIVEDIAPPMPEPDPMMEEELYDDELLMDPWGMPGMGPLPPGF